MGIAVKFEINTTCAVLNIEILLMHFQHNTHAWYLSHISLLPMLLLIWTTVPLMLSLYYWMVMSFFGTMLQRKNSACSIV